MFNRTPYPDGRALLMALLHVRAGVENDLVELSYLRDFEVAEITANGIRKFTTKLFVRFLPNIIFDSEIPL